MLYDKPILEGTLIKRYKRFLADVLVDGELVTVHCANSGSMAGLKDEGNPVRISGPYGPHRKLPYTLEQIQITRPDGEKVWVGVNTAVPNKIVYEALVEKRIPGFEKYGTVLREVKTGNSRIDFKLEEPGLPDCWIEVKNTTLVQADPTTKETINEGYIATFPDAVTARGAKHLNELMERISFGDLAAMIYTVQRSDAKEFAISSGFDPEYALSFKKSIQEGVHIVPITTDITSRGVLLGNEILPLSL